MALPNSANFYVNLVCGAAQTGDYPWGNEPYLSNTYMPFGVQVEVNHPGGDLNSYLRFGYGAGNVNVGAGTKMVVSRLGQATDVGVALFHEGWSVQTAETQSNLPDYPVDPNGNAI
jgi:hypothetical protein